jgi:hypothetical protein
MKSVLNHSNVAWLGLEDVRQGKSTMFLEIDEAFVDLAVDFLERQDHFLQSGEWEGAEDYLDSRDFPDMLAKSAVTVKLDFDVMSGGSAHDKIFVVCGYGGGYEFM